MFSSTPEAALDALGHEILAEKASALGAAGHRAEITLARLRQHPASKDGLSEEDHAALRRKLLKEATDAVYAWFIQRELCGMRRHDSVIRDLQIPREVLVRLGAR